MFLGPFFYLVEPISHARGIYADLLPAERAERNFGKLDNPTSHECLLARLDPSVEYIDIPRGRVIFDTETEEAIIYIDRCIENTVPEIAKLFHLVRYRIDHDEHYVCPRCWDQSKMWE